MESPTSVVQDELVACRWILFSCLLVVRDYLRRGRCGQNLNCNRFGNGHLVKSLDKPILSYCAFCVMNTPTGSWIGV